jgi:hypothetical protein
MAYPAMNKTASLSSNFIGLKPAIIYTYYLILASVFTHACQYFRFYDEEMDTLAKRILSKYQATFEELVKS